MPWPNFGFLLAFASVSPKGRFFPSEIPSPDALRCLLRKANAGLWLASEGRGTVLGGLSGAEDKSESESCRASSEKSFGPFEIGLEGTLVEDASRPNGFGHSTDASRAEDIGRKVSSTTAPLALIRMRFRGPS